jgi:hypothetical protein
VVVVVVEVGVVAVEEVVVVDQEDHQQHCHSYLMLWCQYQQQPTCKQWGTSQRTSIETELKLIHSLKMLKHTSD